MSNEVVFAAAGNGKTYSICKQAREIVSCSEKYVLLVSYTNEGVKSLEKEYKEQNGGVLDSRVIIKTWYGFLLSELIKPYQCLLQLSYKRYKQEYPFNIQQNWIESLAFYAKDLPPIYFNQNHIQYFAYGNGDLVPDRASNLAILCNEHSEGKVIKRMEDLYSHVFFDELQDYAGWDLEIIKLMFQSQMKITCVGDYKQTTYRTNNSTKNSRYRDEKVKDYFAELAKKNLCTMQYANTTRRFNQQICDFVNMIHNDAETAVRPDPECTISCMDENIGVYMLEPKYLKLYCETYHPVILRYSKTTNIEFTNECRIINYGGSKGATYERTLILPVSTVLPFLMEQQYIAKDQTRAKFYVACTRAKHSVVIAVDKPRANEYFSPCFISLEGIEIPAFRFVKPLEH